MSPTEGSIVFLRAQHPQALSVNGGLFSPSSRLATREHRQLCQLWGAQGGRRGGCWETEAQSKLVSACSPFPSQRRGSQDNEVLQESQSLLPRVPPARYVATPLAALLNVKEKTRLRAAPNPTLEHFYLSNGKHPKQVGAAAPMLRAG